MEAIEKLDQERTGVDLKNRYKNALWLPVYRDCLEKGNSAQAYLYIAREGCALYMRETLGVDIG